jgi:RNA polymerase sigma-70 factor, ECF subfamily
MGSHDPELIQRWQRGDPSAFEALLRQWQQPIGRFLFRLTGQADVAQDLCQEVFLRVYHARARYRDNGAFGNWIYRIAMNVARDAGRRRRHRHVSLPEEEVGSEAPGDLVCQRAEIARIVAECVADLPEPMRLVLVLRHYEQMSFEDIARLTNTPASTLKSRFAAALEWLRTRLQARGLGPEETGP